MILTLDTISLVKEQNSLKNQKKTTSFKNGLAHGTLILDTKYFGNHHKTNQGTF